MVVKAHQQQIVEMIHALQTGIKEKEREFSLQKPGSSRLEKVLQRPTLVAMHVLFSVTTYWVGKMLPAY